MAKHKFKNVKALYAAQVKEPVNIMNFHEALHQMLADIAHINIVQRTRAEHLHNSTTNVLLLNITKER